MWFIWYCTHSAHTHIYNMHMHDDNEMKCKPKQCNANKTRKEHIVPMWLGGNLFVRLCFMFFVGPLFCLAFGHSHQSSKCLTHHQYFVCNSSENDFFPNWISYISSWLLSWLAFYCTRGMHVYTHAQWSHVYHDSSNQWWRFTWIFFGHSQNSPNSSVASLLISLAGLHISRSH